MFLFTVRESCCKIHLPRTQAGRSNSKLILHLFKAESWKSKKEKKKKRLQRCDQLTISTCNIDPVIQKRDLIKYLYSNSSNGYSDAALIEFGSVNKRKPEGIFNV